MLTLSVAATSAQSFADPTLRGAAWDKKPDSARGRIVSTASCPKKNGIRLFWGKLQLNVQGRVLAVQSLLDRGLEMVPWLRA